MRLPSTRQPPPQQLYLKTPILPDAADPAHSSRSLVFRCNFQHAKRYKLGSSAGSAADHPAKENGTAGASLPSQERFGCKLQNSVSYFSTCSPSYMADFQADQFENTTWSSTKSTTPNFVVYMQAVITRL